MKLTFIKSVQFIIVFSLIINVVMAETYRWKDDKGQVVFGDKPPKDKTSTAVNIENTEKTGTQFADPGLVNKIKNEAVQNNRKKHAPAKNIDPQCRRYISELNKVEIYLEHTYSDRDQQKARDLRKLIKRECSESMLTQKFADWRCKNYRDDLNKTEIFLEHTSSQRDRNKAKDLRKQLSRECL